MLDDRGREVVDPTPVEIPIGFRIPPTLEDRIRMLVRGEELRLAAERRGFETFRESEDFDIQEDPVDPHTPYEAVFDPLPPLRDKVEVKEPVKEGSPAPVLKEPAKESAKEPVKQ